MSYFNSSLGKRTIDRGAALVLFAMLTENTGRALCDSGGAYGRNWEKAQGKTLADFLKSPAVTCDVYNRGETWEGSYSLNVFHLLGSYAEIDEICKKFNKINLFANECDFEGMYGTAEKAGEYIKSLRGFKWEGETWNSYNWGGPYSQVLQGRFCKIGGDRYILIQIHGGCDVRGGYTTARLLRWNYGDYLPDGRASCLYISVGGVELTADGCGEGILCLDDETQQEKGYGGAREWKMNAKKGEKIPYTATILYDSF